MCKTYERRSWRAGRSELLQLDVFWIITRLLTYLKTSSSPEQVPIRTMSTTIKSCYYYCEICQQDYWPSCHYRALVFRVRVRVPTDRTQRLQNRWEWGVFSPHTSGVFSQFLCPGGPWPGYSRNFNRGRKLGPKLGYESDSPLPLRDPFQGENHIKSMRKLVATPPLLTSSLVPPPSV
jgi:hypothetical protein